MKALALNVYHVERSWLKFEDWNQNIHFMTFQRQRPQLSRISLATHALTRSSLLLTQSGSVAFAVVARA